MCQAKEWFELSTSMLSLASSLCKIPAVRRFVQDRKTASISERPANSTAASIMELGAIRVTRDSVFSPKDRVSGMSIPLEEKALHNG